MSFVASRPNWVGDKEVENLKATLENMTETRNSLQKEREELQGKVSQPTRHLESQKCSPRKRDFAGLPVCCPPPGCLSQIRTNTAKISDLEQELGDLTTSYQDLEVRFEMMREKAEHPDLAQVIGQKSSEGVAQVRPWRARSLRRPFDPPPSILMTWADAS